MWMLGSEGLLHDRQRALVERLGVGVLALGDVEQRHVVEALGHVGVNWSQRILAYGKRPLVEPLRVCVAALETVDFPQEL